MLQISPVALTEIAEANGWLHTTGRLAGTVNASQMAIAVGVAKTTITRAYDGGAAGTRLLEKLSDISGRPIDELIEKRAA